MNEARLTIWDDDACRRVHEATLEVLAETGIDVHYAPAVELFAGAGAQVDGTRVRIPAELVEAAIESAPRDWTIKPRGGDTEPLVLDAGHTYCGTGSDVLYVCDPDTRERRRVRRADVEGMAALCEKLPNIDFVMSMGLPEDAPQAIDDLVQVDAMLRGTRKPLMVAPRDGHILPKMQEMAALAGEARQLRHLRDAGAAPALRRGRRQQGHRLRRARHPAHLGAGAERRHDGAGEHHVGDRRRQRRGARRPRARARPSDRARRSSGASASAR